MRVDALKSVILLICLLVVMASCSAGGGNKKKHSPPPPELITKTVAESKLAKDLFGTKKFEVTDVGQYYYEQLVVIWPIRVVVNGGKEEYTMEIFKGNKGAMEVRLQR